MQNRSASVTRKIKIWDPFVRLFHGVLLVSFVFDYVTAQAGMQYLHALVGYVLIGLLSARIVWGLIGCRYARFSSFVYRPKRIVWYLQSILSGHPRRYLGHNPAGGAMIVLMFIMLLVIFSSGLLIQGTLEFTGPFQMLWLHDQWVYVIYELHVVSVNIFLLLIMLHITGVIVGCIQNRENLVWSMITGYKKQRLE